MTRTCSCARAIPSLAIALAAALAAPIVSGCRQTLDPAAPAQQSSPKLSALEIPRKLATPAGVTAASIYRGLDRNDYPDDATMQALHATFAFTGYWLTPPPGERSNSWLGKRPMLRQQGWGFLLLANGRFDKEILKARKAGTAPAQLGRQDAAAAIAAAKSEGFPAHAIIFLDQEEGGALLDEQAEYLLGWTEAVAASDYLPGAYASGQPVPDGPGKTIDTIRHIRSLVNERHLHQVAAFDYQDACPPSPGCTLSPKPLSAAGEPEITIWQYAQSPRRPEITGACKKTYDVDGNCYAPGFPTVSLDLDAATSPDPSNGR